MKIAQAAEDGDDKVILLFRPITAEQLGLALNKWPFEVIRDFLEIDCFVNLRTEIEDASLLEYSRVANFEFQIVD